MQIQGDVCIWIKYLNNNWINKNIYVFLPLQ